MALQLYQVIINLNSPEIAMNGEVFKSKKVNQEVLKAAARSAKKQMDV